MTRRCEMCPSLRLWFTAKDRTCGCGRRWIYRYGTLAPWGPGGVFTASKGRRWVRAALEGADR